MPRWSQEVGLHVRLDVDAQYLPGDRLMALEPEKWPWLLAEDEALKKAYSGFTVSGRGDAEIPVKVFYRWPENEQIERISPFITIDLINLERAAEREQRGRMEVGEMAYQPYGYPEVPEGHSLRVDWPVPYDIIYQVTTHAHLIQHDRELWGKVLTYGIRDRYGWIFTEQTQRRVDVMGISPMDGRDPNGRRIFRKAIVLRVSSELPEPVAQDLITGRVERVVVNAYDLPSYERVFEFELSEDTAGVDGDGV